jgi:hypothetical protein
MSRTKSSTSHIEPWINSYVQIVRRKMNLGEWKITLYRKPCANDSLGECDVTYGQHCAVISLHKDYRKEKPENLRNTIVHELLHCYFSPITEAAMQALEPFEEDVHGRKIIQSTVNSVEYQIERVIDRLSDIIAPTMPLPKIPNEKKKRVSRKIRKKKSSSHGETGKRRRLKISRL